MSLYADYIKEREDKEIVESDLGFATFKTFPNGECYLQDLYVAPQMRKSGLATTMTNQIVQIAKERGCHTLVGSVCTDDNNATRNMKVFLSYGMQIQRVVGNIILLNKSIAGDK